MNNISSLFELCIKKLNIESIDELIHHILELRYGMIYDFYADKIILFKELKFNNISQIIFFIRYEIYTSTIVFDNDFNEQFNNINMPYLTHLTFGRDFNQPFNNSKLKYLTHLTFGKHFNKNLLGYFPNLTHLTVGASFNGEINGSQFPNLTHLTVGRYYNQPLNCSEFKNLRQLTLPHDYNKLSNGNSVELIYL
jgi:hypothetical protein